MIVLEEGDVAELRRELDSRSWDLEAARSRKSGVEKILHRADDADSRGISRISC